MTTRPADQPQDRLATTRPLAARSVSIVDINTTKQLLTSWLATPSLRQLVEAFGGSWPQSSSLSHQLYQLETFSAVWDFRAGRERFDAPVVTISQTHHQLIDRAAHDLGLSASTQPSLRHYDYAIALGGTATSCLLRTRLLARLLHDHAATFGQIILLGSSRPVMPAERAAGDAYAPEATTEFDLLCAATESEFRLDPVARSLTPAEPARHYQLPSGPALSVINVPTTDPSRRTNTADQYRFLADHYRLQPLATVLIATSQIYYPFHLFGALADLALPTGVTIEVVGYPVDWAGAASALRAPQNVLQEIRSAIRAAHALAIQLDHRANAGSHQ